MDIFYYFLRFQKHPGWLFGISEPSTVSWDVQPLVTVWKERLSSESPSLQKVMEPGVHPKFQI